mgnify:FL=1
MYKEDAYVLRKGFGAANYPFEDPRARRLDYAGVKCPTAHWLTDRTVSFFTHPVYTEEHVGWMIDAFRKVADHYQK